MIRYALTIWLLLGSLASGQTMTPVRPTLDDFMGDSGETLTSPARRNSERRIDGRVLTKPTGFDFTPTILPVYRNGSWVGSAAARSLVVTPTGSTYYVDCIFGSDANTGGSSDPFQSIETALEQSDTAFVFIAPGWYNRNFNWGAAGIITSASGIIVKPWRIRAGEVICSTSWPHTTTDWDRSTHSTACYQTARTSVAKVLDTSQVDFVWDGARYHPKYREYVEVDNSTDLAAIAGSWFDDAGTLHVHPISVRGPTGMPAAYNQSDVNERFAPAETLRILLAETNAFWDDNKNLYCEGITFIGGDEAFWINHTASGQTAVHVFSQCFFGYASDATDGNGLRVVGGANIDVLERCTAAFNARDGFNYHFHAVGGAEDVIEVGCIAIQNGTTADGTNNASTVHDGVDILRIGGRYGLCEGPSIADVGGGDSWNVGLYILPSQRIGSSITRSSLYNSACTMWAYDCRVEASDNNAGAVTSSGTSYLHNTELQSVTESGGVFSEYTQD